MALPYLQKPVEVSAIMSYEAARAVPTWKADESVFSLLISLREKTLKDVIVQLRSEQDELLDLSKRGLIDQFYDGQIAIREALLYPPYSTFILLSYTGTKEETAKIEEMLSPILSPYKPNFYSAPHSQAQKVLRYALLRLPSQNLPDEKLTETLRILPPYIKIEVNPDRIV